MPSVLLGAREPEPLVATKLMLMKSLLPALCSGRASQSQVYVAQLGGPRQGA